MRNTRRPDFKRALCLYMICDNRKKQLLCSDEALLEPLFRDRNDWQRQIRKCKGKEWTILPESNYFVSLSVSATAESKSVLPNQKISCASSSKEPFHPSANSSRACAHIWEALNAFGCPKASQTDGCSHHHETGCLSIMWFSLDIPENLSLMVKHHTGTASFPHTVGWEKQLGEKKVKFLSWEKDSFIGQKMKGKE